LNGTTGEAPAGRAGFWQRTVGWTLDAALLAPPALLLTWPWIAAPLRAVAARWDALLHATGTAMAQALLRAQGEIAGLLSLVLALVHDPALREANARLSSALWAAVWPPLLAFVLLGAAWQVGFERSRWQASPGRRALGLHVEDSEGRRLSARRALARHLAGTLSWLTLNIGHLMAAAAPRHLALHDRISDTRVCSARAALPAWAAAWLALATLGPLALLVWLVGDASATLRGALEAALL
jgi:uncharacterized RDD family membrane protein YckC